MKPCKSVLPVILIRVGTCIGLFLAGLFLLQNLLSFRSHEASLAEEFPKVLDNRLELTLFAENPQIVTPIGIAIDSLNRIFVLESHTHQPPSDYKGPKGDLIKVFQDQDGDGKPEKESIFAEGIKEGLNLAFSPDGNLYVVTSREVWVLYDRDGNGLNDEKVKVLELVEPASVYAHAALLGITFSSDGWMYISRGNTSGSAWKLKGTDGSSVSGYGDGGNVVKARPDGTGLEEVATGFWNPMDIKFDKKGHLLAADNDPDSRGPNRLVHVVPGGDYGYQSLYGGSGIHPYLAWNGELPGTLPFAVGLGEAPSGLLNADHAALPADYRGGMLASIWEESRIVRISLAPKGVSVTGSTKVVVEGGLTFRPVAFATDRDGTIYFTDWVLRDYANHSRGRIWRLKAKPAVAVVKPAPLYSASTIDSEKDLLGLNSSKKSNPDFDQLRKALISPDPFLRHAAITGLSGPQFQQQAIQATSDQVPEVRLGALLALQRSGYSGAEPLLRAALSDSDERIRQRTLIWIGQQGLAELRPELDKAIISGTTSPALFETYLETITHLSPEFIQSYRSRKEQYAKSIKRMLPAHFLENFIQEENRPPSLRAMAVRYISNPVEQKETLLSLLKKENDQALQTEIIRSLATVPDPAVTARLVQLATDTANPVLLRAEALGALSRQPADLSQQVLPLLYDSSPVIQLEAARYLRLYSTVPEVRKAVQQKVTMVKKPASEALSQQLTLVLAPSAPGTAGSGRPVTVADWQKRVATGGEAVRGRRVFYSVQSACASCHSVEGRGGDLGPDLTNVGLSKSRQQLIESILRPSEEISPEWQGWYIKLKNGEVHQGRQIDVGGKEIELYTQSAGFVAFQKKDIQDYGMIKNSLMPEGLEHQLTVNDLRDLLAFLQSQSTSR